MKVMEIGAFEAKNKLSNLLDKVEQGQRIMITRRGKNIAMLVSPAELMAKPAEMSPDELIEKFAAFRKRIAPVGVPLKSLVNEGRRI